MAVRRRDAIAALPPPALLGLTYIFLIAIGTLLLALPISQQEEVGLYDAFFMATSAVTVTGLVVVDTGTAFTVFGEAVIIGLMQLGGLGLMTFAALLLVTLGIRVGIPSRVILAEELGPSSIGALTKLAKLILVVALVAEAIGALLLAFIMVPEDGLIRGVWSAIFHTVSAFNNAGFSLYPDSLTRFRGTLAVDLFVPLMFIVGGLGFVVLGDIYQKRAWRPLTLHSKLMIAGSAVLLVVGTIAFALLEWNNPGTLGEIESLSGKLGASFFQAATPRTAGFNTLDIGALKDSTALMTMLLMFIGGGPTSTAGGIKVTTAIVLVLAIVAFFRRQQTLTVFGRSLDLKTVLEVMALTTLSVIVLFGALFTLLLTHKGDFLHLCFEAVSAFGTVGLSRGATGDLDAWGKGVICLLMFFGRVGPMTLGFFLATRTAPRVRYPKGEVYLG